MGYHDGTQKNEYEAVASSTTSNCILFEIMIRRLIAYKIAHKKSIDSIDSAKNGKPLLIKAMKQAMKT